VCQGHTAKTIFLTAKIIFLTAKALSCATHGKGHTANKHRQRLSLPCAFCRAHGKEYGVLDVTHGKQNTRNKKNATGSPPATAALLDPPESAPAVVAPPDFRRRALGPRPPRP